MAGDTVKGLWVNCFPYLPAYLYSATFLVPFPNVCVETSEFLARNDSDGAGFDEISFFNPEGATLLIKSSTHKLVS